MLVDIKNLKTNNNYGQIITATVIRILIQQALKTANEANLPLVNVLQCSNYTINLSREC